MQVYSFDTFGRSICVACISGYQKHLSPRKGFACAHRILYREESCSQYIKKVIACEGIRVAIKKSHVRFQECKEASQILRAHKMSSQTSEEREKTNKHRNSSINQCLDNVTNACQCADPSCIDVVDCAFTDHSSLNCDLPDCSAFDCNILDCGCGG